MIFEWNWSTVSEARTVKRAWYCHPLCSSRTELPKVYGVVSLSLALPVKERTALGKQSYTLSKIVLIPMRPGYHTEMILPSVRKIRQKRDLYKASKKHHTRPEPGGGNTPLMSCDKSKLARMIIREAATSQHVQNSP